VYDMKEWVANLSGSKFSSSKSYLRRQFRRPQE